MPLVGPKPLVTGGCLVGAAGMFYLTGLGPNETYVGSILPALILSGLGFGLIFAPSITTATLGVSDDEAGIASGPRLHDPPVETGTGVTETAGV